MSKLLVCPKCGSNKVRVLARSAYDANTGDFIVHSHKTQDGVTHAYCGNFDIECNWHGIRSELIEVEND